MPSKIRIKFGSVEVDYEGDETFFKNELPKIVEEIFQSIKNVGFAEISEEVKKTSIQGQLVVAKDIIGSVTTIAQKLNVKQGAELILAVAAKFAIGQELDSFSREDLLKEMRTAKPYFKQSYVKNLSIYLNNLIKSGKLLMNAPNIYALSPETKAELEGKLGS